MCFRIRLKWQLLKGKCCWLSFWHPIPRYLILFFHPFQNKRQISSCPNPKAILYLFFNQNWGEKWQNCILFSLIDYVRCACAKILIEWQTFRARPILKKKLARQAVKASFFSLSLECGRGNAGGANALCESTAGKIVFFCLVYW